MFRTRRATRTSIVLTLTLFFVMAYIPSASASTYTVGCPGTGPTTLLSALNFANGGSVDTMVLTPGCRYNVFGPLVFTDSDPTTVIGNGATIDGAGTFQVISVNSSAVVELDRVNVANGAAGTGGGGGIFNEGNLTLRNSNVLSGTAAQGGGIANLAGSVFLINSNVVRSVAQLKGGGIYTKSGVLQISESSHISGNSTQGEGAGIYNEGTRVTVSDSRLSDNVAGQGGGGMFNFSPTPTTFTRSTVSDNRADAGGAFLNYSDLVLQTDTLVTDNRSSGDGGAIYSGGGVTVVDSTITDNTAAHFGGGIVNANSVMLDHARVTDNSAANAGGVFNWGDFYPTGQPVLTIKSSLISHNRADSGNGGGILNRGGKVKAILGSSVSDNFATGDGGGIFNINLTDGRIGTVDFTDAKLSDNRTTDTPPTSAGGGIDNFGTATFVTSTIAGNHAPNGGGVMNFGTLLLKSSTASENDAFAGGGLSNHGTASLTDSTVANNTAERGGGIFNDRVLAIDRSTIDGNRATGFGGGGILNLGAFASVAQIGVKDSTLSANRALAGNGGGLYNIGGYVTIAGTINPQEAPRSSRLVRNRAQFGGATYNEQHGLVRIVRTLVSLNRAEQNAGAILNTGNGSAVRVALSRVTTNRARRDGGGLWNDNDGVIDVSDTTLAENVAGELGGAALNRRGTMDISYSTLSGNAANAGGGLASVSAMALSTVTIFNSTLSDNTAEAAGGGVLTAGHGDVTLSWTTLLGNDNAPAGFPNGGSLYNSSGLITVTSSIVASSRGTYTPLPNAPGESNCRGTIVGTNSLSNDPFGAPPSCGTGFVVANPRLATSLGLNGNASLTSTHRLFPGPGTGMGASCPPLDQRHLPRPANGCNIGAYQ